MQIRESALDVANRVRAIFGLAPLMEMPRGRRSDPTCCPIANAVKRCAPGGGRVEVASHIKVFDANGKLLAEERDPAVAEFIKDFDGGGQSDLALTYNDPLPEVN